MNPTPPSALSIFAARGLGRLPRGVYFNTPGAESAAPAAPAAAPAAPAAAPASPAPAAPATPAAPAAGAGKAAPAAGGSFTDEHAYRLGEINARIEADPDTELSPEDQELYDAGVDGKLTAKTRAEGEEKPGSEGVEGEKVSPEIEAAMKEVGAKTVSEMVDKIKELRKAVSGRDAQAYAQLEARFKEVEAFRRSEVQLYEDAKAGKPEALEFIEKHRGLKVVPAGAPAAPVLGKDGKSLPAAAAPAAEEPPFTPEDDQLVGGALSKMHQYNQGLRAQMEQLHQKLNTALEVVEADKAARAQASAEQTAKSQTVQEMLEVAQFHDELKALPELQGRLADFLQGKDDAQISPFFTRLFEIAKQERCSLKAAFYMERGRNADALIAKAREDGVRAAMGKPENKSLSPLPASETPGAGQDTATESQLAAYEAGDTRALPESWFDANGDFIPAKVPQKFHERLAIFPR